jgi:hypothetical protein
MVCKEDTRVYTGSGRTSLRPVRAAHVLALVSSRGYKRSACATCASTRRVARAPGVSHGRRALRQDGRCEPPARQAMGARRDGLSPPEVTSRRALAYCHVRGLTSDVGRMRRARQRPYTRGRARPSSCPLGRVRQNPSHMGRMRPSPCPWG